MDISHLLDKEFKEIVIRVLTKLESGIQKLKTTTKFSGSGEQHRAGI